MRFFSNDRFVYSAGFRAAKDNLIQALSNLKCHWEAELKNTEPAAQGKAQLMQQLFSSFYDTELKLFTDKTVPYNQENDALNVKAFTDKLNALIKGITDENLQKLFAHRHPTQKTAAAAAKTTGAVGVSAGAAIAAGILFAPVAAIWVAAVGVAGCFLSKDSLVNTKSNTQLCYESLVTAVNNAFVSAQGEIDYFRSFNTAASAAAAAP